MGLLTLLQRASLSHLLAFGTTAFIAYWISVYIYRVTLHPLAKFPGPELAGATFWYEFYYDLFPHKLHPEYLDDIYASGRRKRNRDEWFFHSSKTSPMGWSLFNTVDHDVHRVRRAALSPFFSKRSIQALEGRVVEKIDILIDRIAEARKTGENVNLLFAAGALTMDVISAYAFGKDWNKLGEPDWAEEELEGYAKMAQMGPFARQFPWVAKAVIMLLPPKLVTKLSPAAALVPRNRALFKDMIQTAVEEEQNGQLDKSASRSIFQDILQSNLPPSDKTPARLSAEAGLLVMAGTETTARSLAVILFLLLDTPHVLDRVRKELAQHMPRPDSRISLAELEAIPYFSAMITEGVRLSHVVSSRMPRYAPEEELKYKDWTIPAGTSVMQSHYLLHTDPTIFPEPYTFEPQRWIDNPSLRANYFLGFGRGTRVCLGINLANAELYLTVAYICARFDMELFETERGRDVDVVMDSVIGQPSLESKGIRVKITRDRLKDEQA
ncbi:hypothetical protein N7447_004783 [Penicillium robsamsonii]|uniref:uncharacterized protein n=1 Tax=Penicillium robsamsonii TaxID=1792511 RepID=UPI002547D6EE|nr:uncharacterized protein N7447_004783 [Penicillium robsamsonii]KAJ5822443.1 hypothetical protein N7447_004783 [Penicillium robsamsonii]